MEVIGQAFLELLSPQVLLIMLGAGVYGLTMGAIPGLSASMAVGLVIPIGRNLFETLRRVKQPDPELSPRWRGQAIAQAVAGFKVPVWSVAAIAAVALLGVYFVFRALLAGNAEAASTALLSVHPKGEIGIMRKVFSAPPPPPPPPPQPPKVCAAVQPPIVCLVTPNVVIVHAGKVIVDE